MSAIHFFSEDIEFHLKKPQKRTQWVKSVVQKEKKKLGIVNYIFCSDAYLAEINLTYLNHKSLTDIITFDNREDSEEISGDIFISIDRVVENAQKLNILFNDELDRVIIHGILHLIGYSDKSVSTRSIMRKKEDAYLSLR